MSTDNLSPHTLVSLKIAEIESEITKILADAERRVAPLKLQLQRYRIADEVWRDIAPTQAPAASKASEATALHRQVTPKRSVRMLLLGELGASALPLSKAELLDRFIASGESPVESTVGSTLSNMVKAGFLVKGEWQNLLKY